MVKYIYWRDIYIKKQIYREIQINWNIYKIRYI